MSSRSIRSDPFLDLLSRPTFSRRFFTQSFSLVFVFHIFAAIYSKILDSNMADALICIVVEFSSFRAFPEIYVEGLLANRIPILGRVQKITCIVGCGIVVMAILQSRQDPPNGDGFQHRNRALGDTEGKSKKNSNFPYTANERFRIEDIGDEDQTRS